MHLVFFSETAIGPMHEQRHTVSTFIRRPFFTAHSGVISCPDELLRIQVASGRGTVIGHEDKDGVFLKPQDSEMVPEPCHVVVNIGDHPPEIRAVAFHTFPSVNLTVGIGDTEGPVWRIRREVAEKRTVLIAFSLSLNERHRLLKPDIRAVTIKGLFRTVSEIGVIEIVVAPVIRGLTDAATAVVEGFVETSVVWTEGVVIAEMPFPEHTRLIAVASEDIRHRDLVTAQE